MGKTRRHISMGCMIDWLIMLSLVLMGSVNAEPLELLDSVEFAYQYEQDELSSNEDLDNDGNIDFYANNAGELPVISDGIASFDTGDFYRTDFTDSVWRANFPQDVDYTIEARIWITETDPGDEGTLGIMGIFVRDMGDNSCTIAYVGMNRVQVNDGGTVTELDTSDNTDGFHIFRVARNAEGYWVWRDNVLLNPDESTPFSEPTIGGGKGHFLGDTSGTGNNGSWDLDWLRLDNTGAYGPESRVASKPNPKNGKGDVPRDVTLSWKPGDYAVKHDVYFGTTFDDVNNADRNTPMGNQLAQDHDANSIDAGRLAFGQTYFWRVDEVNAAPDHTIFKGNVWSFTIEPYSIQIPGSEIVATVSSSSNDVSTPEKTLDGSGLGADGTHAIQTESMWFTAMGDLDPWIQYEFDRIKKLDTMKVWNSNSTAEGFIGYGVKGVVIEYSKDGEIWEILEGATEFSRAPGLPTYNQYDEIVFGGLAAKMVRLNIKSNWGGFMQSYSLSEVQFSMIPTAARASDPASGSSDVLLNSVLAWRAGREAAQSTVYVSTDSNDVAGGMAPSATSNTNSIDLSSFDLQMGQTYYWRVDEVNEAEVESVWVGPVWSFSTVAAMIVDDFESYGNNSPDRPFQTWLDGFGYSEDEFFPVGYEGNGTGSGVGHDIWSISSPHYDGKIMETTYTIPGSSQSLPFYYTNMGGAASQTERTFAEPQDWTIGGAKTLSIAFRGQADNTGTLYVRINDTKLVYPHTASNIALGEWQVWGIDLSSIDVQSITALQIGVDGVGVTGMIYIDDIGLYP